MPRILIKGGVWRNTEVRSETNASYVTRVKCRLLGIL